MADRRSLDEVRSAFESGRLDRRELLIRLVALGASAGSVGALLEACGSPAAPEVAPEAGDGLEDELHIANFSDYIDEETVPAFEKAYGVSVSYTTYETNEELLAKLAIGASGYDLVVPTGYTLTALIAQGLLSPLDKALLPSWSNLAPFCTDTVFDPGNVYSVPWQWGVTGIAYRADKVAAPPDSWGVFLDPAYAGKMTQTDDMRDCLGAWLRYRGKSVNSVDPAELDQMKRDAIAAKANLAGYISAPVKGQLVAGDVWIAQMWNGDTQQAKVEQPNLSFVLPKEGSLIWIDHLVLPKTARNKRAAHAFMEFVLRPEVASRISDFTGYGSPNAKATLKTPVPYPTPQELAILEFSRDLGEATAAWDRIWTEIKSA